MLRLRPTVISLTMAEVREYEARRASHRHMNLVDRSRPREPRMNGPELRVETREMPRTSSGASFSQLSAASEEISVGKAILEPDSSDDSDDEGSADVWIPSAQSSGMVENILGYPDVASRPSSSLRNLEEFTAGQPGPSPDPRPLAATPRRFAPAARHIEEARASERTTQTQPGRSTSASATASQSAAPRPNESELEPTQTFVIRLPSLGRTEPEDVPQQSARAGRYHLRSSHRMSNQATSSTSRTVQDLLPEFRSIEPITPRRHSSLHAHTDGSRNQYSYQSGNIRSGSRQTAAEHGDGDVEPILSCDGEAGPSEPQLPKAKTPQATDTTSVRMTPPSPSPSPSPRTPRLQVYNDTLPASSQPQTPRNLAEARHQSRLQGSYTVPVRRASRLPVQTPKTGRRTRWRDTGRRSQSPRGLQTPGFLGLYGGMENSDDAQLFQEAQQDLGPAASRVTRPSSPRE